METTFNQPDGLYLSPQATLAQLLEDEALHLFAAGLLHAALVETCRRRLAPCNFPLTEALHYTAGPEIYPLLTALLALDAEVHTLVGEKRRIMPLPGFLSYRASLPPEKVPLAALRLPPLNPNGRYIFTVLENEISLAARFDLNERLRVVGHVRLALSSPTRPPIRLRVAEDRLERRVIEAALIEATIAGASDDLASELTLTEQAGLVEALKKLLLS